MQTPEEFARLIADECVEGYYDRFYDEDAAALIRARDEAIRADERARVSVVHSTLTDQALVDELVRRGVFREETRRLDDGMAYTTLDREGVVRTGGRPQTGQRRYVGPWEADDD